jgi:hypothetical protein
LRQFADPHGHLLISSSGGSPPVAGNIDLPVDWKYKEYFAPTPVRGFAVTVRTCLEKRCRGSVGMAVVGVREVWMAMPQQWVRMGVRGRATSQVAVLVRMRIATNPSAMRRSNP